MKASVALLATALLLTASLAGCGGKKGDSGTPAPVASAAPTLYLNVTVGNHTFPFTSSGSGSMSHASLSGGNHSASSSSGNASHSGSSSSGSNGTLSHAGMGHGNMTANATGPSGAAPLNVTVTLGASGVPAGKALAWALDFGDGNVTGLLGSATHGATGSGSRSSSAASSSAGNHTASSSAAGNHTGSPPSGTAASAAATGKLPATLSHTYVAVGLHNVTFRLSVAGGAPVALHAGVTVLNGTGAAGNATGAVKPGTVLGTVPLDQTGTLTGVQGLSCSSATGPAPDATFAWEFPAADANGTPAQVSHVSLLLTQGSTNLDASLHFLDPTGKEITSADDSSAGFGNTETIEADGPFAAGAYSVKVVACTSANGSFTLHGEATLVAT